MTALIQHISVPAATALDLAAVDEAAFSYAGQAGDTEGTQPRLREALIRLALPFATRLARRYRGRGEPLEDLEQVARLALVRAVDRYDAERGPFTAYASATIVGELRRHFRDTTWSVHVPRRLQELSLEVGRAVADLTAELARRPTVVEVAGRVGATEVEVREAMGTAAAYLPVSLNMPVGGDGSGELGELIGHPDFALDAVDNRMTVGALLCRLPARERQLLALRFYGNLTQAQIATELGISQMHVSRLLGRALFWLREAMLSDTPPHWEAVPAQPLGQALAVHTRVVGPTAIVEVVGEVDRDTAARLRERLLEAVRRADEEIRLDLSRVPFLDAAGSAAILAGASAARQRGVRLRLVNPQRYVRHVLLVAGLRRLVEPAPVGPA